MIPGSPNVFQSEVMAYALLRTGIYAYKMEDLGSRYQADPDKHLTEDEIAEIATSGTDALILSGTLNITKDNMSGSVTR